MVTIQNDPALVCACVGGAATMDDTGIDRKRPEGLTYA